MKTRRKTAEGKINSISNGELSRLVLIDLSEENIFTEKYRKALKLAAARKLSAKN
jgi:hypothetical protein